MFEAYLGLRPATAQRQEGPVAMVLPATQGLLRLPPAPVEVTATATAAARGGVEATKPLRSQAPCAARARASRRRCRLLPEHLHGHLQHRQGGTHGLKSHTQYKHAHTATTAVCPASCNSTQQGISQSSQLLTVYWFSFLPPQLGARGFGSSRLERGWILRNVPTSSLL